VFACRIRAGIDFFSGSSAKLFPELRLSRVANFVFLFLCIVEATKDRDNTHDFRPQSFLIDSGLRWLPVEADECHDVRGGIRMDESQRYEQGMKTRRAVLGDAHVDATLKNRNEFTEAFQDFITRYAWGEIWSRPGLPKETRSMLTLAMMVAQNRPDELRMHLRAAKNVGVTREQIQEVLLQSAIYCGLPAANSAFHIAMEVFAEKQT
jgi:4-carboxymuconolactone decarboxylase